MRGAASRRRAEGQQRAARDGHQAEAHEAAQLSEIPGAELVGEDGSDTVCEAHVDGRQKHLGVEDDGDGGDAVGTGVAEGQDVEQEGRDADGELRDELRAAVVHGLAECAPFELRLGEAERPAAAPEVEEADDSGEQVSDARRKAGAEDAETEVGEEEVVEARVRQPCQHRDAEALHRPAVGDEECVEEDHQRGKGEEGQQGVEIAAAVREQLWRSAEQEEQPISCGNGENGQGRGERDGSHGDQCEAAACGRRFPFAEILGDEGRAARGQHDREAEHEVDDGVDDVRGGQRIAASKAADEDAVRHRVE